ncbi:MAG: transglutaminase domain protein, partial [Verrucomicrobia bacterium]|nr:transglutaminase domain protein [Verrucomicrobiota bacterium]
ALMLRPGVGPEDAATVRRMVAEITKGAALTEAGFAEAAMGWLRERHGYSLSPQVPDGSGDPLVRWMNSRGSGHCELFAGSLVLLARVAGYPARVITGFKGGSWNGYSNNYTIRNSDAHAWCEIFDATAAAWRRADPTPGATGLAQADEVRGEAALARRTDRSWSARLESLRVFWYRRIVNFDQRSQVETLKAVKDATENSGRRLRALATEWMVAAKAWLARPWGWGRIFSVTAVMAAAAGAAWLLDRFGGGWLRAARGGASQKGQDPTRAEAGRWLWKIAGDRGHGAEHGAVVDDLRRIRFGPRETWPNARPVFVRARRSFRKGGARG